MDFRAWAKVLLGVCEKIMRTCTDKIRATDFWISDGELSVSRGGTGAHKLLCKGIISRCHLELIMIHFFEAHCLLNLPSSFLCSAAMTWNVKYDQIAAPFIDEIVQVSQRSRAWNTLQPYQNPQLNNVNYGLLSILYKDAAAEMTG